MNPASIVDAFPAPSFRETQEETLHRIRDAYLEGNDVVLVRAPTGSGKSLLARAVAGSAASVEDAEPSAATGAYYTTPQVSQLEDVANDPLLADMAVIRGKSNYDCILPGETDTPVDQAPCARVRGFDCSIQHRCPYFSDRAIASQKPIAAMTLAYFMQTAGSDVFRKRDVVVIDEAHGLAEWAEMYATIRLAPETVPIWDELTVPDVTDTDRAVRFADGLVTACTNRKEALLQEAELTPETVRERDRLQELIGDLKWFVSEYRSSDSPTTWLVDQEAGEGSPITIRPLNPERFLRHTIWDRGTAFALFSATILNKAAFCRSVGLDPSRVALVDVEHTFPLEHRPLYDVTRGKMTYEQRDETLPKVARTIVRIMQAHPDEKGIVHAHSYAIQERLAELLENFRVGHRVRTHDRADRDASLAAWQAADEPAVFLSVKMEEALDLEGDLARFQVLCKAPFPNPNDARVAHRLEDGQWGWYNRAALRTVIQACGRVVRSPEDHGATYLADESLLDLFDRARGDLPPWFADQVAAMSTPSLPPFKPVDACSVESTPTRTVEPDPAGSSEESSGRKSPLSDVWDS